MNCSCNSVITKPQPLNCLVLKKKNAFQFMIKSVIRYNTIQFYTIFGCEFCCTLFYLQPVLQSWHSANSRYLGFGTTQNVTPSYVIFNS